MKETSSQPNTTYAAVYARYSDGSHQTDQSIEGQLAEARKYAQSHGLTIIREYCDRRISGRSDDRAEFQKMLRDSAKGEWTALVVWKNDRIGRNRYELAVNKHTLRKNGVTIFYVAEQIPDTPEGVILEATLEAMAEYYSLQLSTNVRRGLRESVKKGKLIGPLPYGYKTDADKQIYADPGQAAIVQRIFREYAGGKALKEIIDDLTAEGHRSGTGKPFTINQVTAMLKNRKYIGEYAIKGEIMGSIPAIVERELFDQVQEMLVRNRRAPKKEWTKVEYLLTGKLFCGHCESPMVGVSGTGRRGTVYHYYDCMGHRRRACSKKPVRKEWIEQQVMDQIRRILLDDALLEKIADNAFELYESDRDTSYEDGLRRQLSEVEKGIRNIVQAVEAGMISASLTDRMNDLEIQRRELKETLAAARLSSDIPITRDMILFFLTRFRDMDPEDPEARRRLVETFVNAIYLWDDKITMTFNYSGDTRRVTLQDIESGFVSLSDVSFSGSYSSLQGVPKEHLTRQGGVLFLNSQGDSNPRPVSPLKGIPWIIGIPVPRSPDQTVFVTACNRHLRQFQYVTFGHVDDPAPAIVMFSGKRVIIAKMYMPMEQVLRMIPVQQFQERLKAPVGRILQIPQAPRRRMGDDDIHAAAARQGEPQPPNTTLHLPIGILVRSRMILPAAA